jgi:hypothetical protein
MMDCTNCRLLLAALLIGLSLAPPRNTCADDRRPPDVFLRDDMGLVRFGRANEWIQRRELSLRTRIDELPKLKENIQANERQLVERIEQNRQLWQVRRQTELRLKQLAATRSTSDPQRQQLEQQIATLRTQAVPPDELGGMPDVQSRLVDLTSDRNRLTLSIVWVRETAPVIVDEYARLRADDRVTAALRKLGGNHTLGSGKSLDAELKQLAQYEPLLNSPSLPMYRQSGLPRVGAIINDRTPVTFTWRDSSEPATVTRSMLEAAGIKLPDDASRVEQTFGNRRLTTRQVTIPYLRFGRCVLRDVDAFVLPPEGEDLGAQIGPAAFTGYSVKAEPEWLRLTIKPIE